VPLVLFFVAVCGVVLAAGYYLFTTFFGARVAARCAVPGDVFVDLVPADNPIRIDLCGDRDRADAGRRVRIELEREGSWLWSREVEIGAQGLASRHGVDEFSIDRPGRYRVRGSVGRPASGMRAGRAHVQVSVRVHRIRPAVYVLASGMLLGGVGGLVVLIAR
jgi:hypothetical protein